MKGKFGKISAGVLYAALAICVAMGGVACLVTAFPVDRYAELGTVALWCSLWAAFAAICFSYKKGHWVLLGAAALILGYMWREGTLASQLELLIYRISVQYDKGYGWGVAQWSAKPERAGSIDMALILLGCVVLTLLLRSLIRRKTVYVGLIFSVLPLASCCVLTDSVPEVSAILLLLLPLAVILFSQGVRRRDERTGARLTALLLVPVLLAGLLLNAALPREDYELQLSTLRQQVLSWFSNLPFVVQTPDGQLIINMDGVSPSDLDLGAVGPKSELTYPVMDVTAPRTQTLYLRAQTFDRYDGKGWYASKRIVDETAFWPADGTVVGTVTITTHKVQPYLFTSYYTQGATEFRQGKVENTGELTQYSFHLIDATENAPMGETPDARYTNLPASIQGQLAARVRTILRDRYGTEILTRRQKVQAICEYVKNSAAYDLNTQRMPKDAEDFTLWFLDESETGYCVHFATAATVLLRAAGVPARYVTGYSVEVQADVTTEVTGGDAHAWVEFLDDEQGWTVADPTPGIGGTIMIPTEPSGPEPTEPPTEVPTVPPTEEPTLPPTTAPTEEPTLPPTQAATQPSESVQPSEPSETGQTETLPIQQGQTQTGQMQDLGLLWTLLKILCAITALLVLLLGQYLLRVSITRRRLRRGHPNAQALKRWCYALKLGKIQKLTPPVQLEELAEKAKFSQHTLTEGELAVFDEWIALAQDALKRKNWFIRTAIRLIFAV